MYLTRIKVIKPKLGRPRDAFLFIRFDLARQLTRSDGEDNCAQVIHTQTQEPSQAKPTYTYSKPQLKHPNLFCLIYVKNISFQR